MFLVERSYIFGVLVVALNALTATVAQAQVNSKDTRDLRLFPCLEDGLNQTSSVVFFSLRRKSHDSGRSTLLASE